MVLLLCSAVRTISPIRRTSHLLHCCAEGRRGSYASYTHPENITSTSLLCRGEKGFLSVLHVSCHFKTQSRGGVIIYEKRIISSFPTMRRIQTFITRYQDLKDAFARHAKTSRRVQKTRQDAKTSKMPSHGTHTFQDII